MGFESPFTKNLNPGNRWVKLAKQITWDKIANVYQRQLNNSIIGVGGINPRAAISALFIKHMCDLRDREAVQQIQENVYMQYFIGYSSFSFAPVFDPSLFVDLRKRFERLVKESLGNLIMYFVYNISSDTSKIMYHYYFDQNKLIQVGLTKFRTGVFGGGSSYYFKNDKLFCYKTNNLSFIPEDSLLRFGRLYLRKDKNGDNRFRQCTTRQQH